MTPADARRPTTWSILGEMTLTAGPGDDAHRLGQRRRQPDRHAPGQAARRPARAHRRVGHAGGRLPAGRHRERARRRASSTRRCSSTARPTATSPNGATTVATLFANASDLHAEPGRDDQRTSGSNGGQAAAFTFDLARSIVYTRQGNPAWAGQERDGVTPDPLGRPLLRRQRAPDWVDLSKVAIPQADEQQRLLANLIGHVNADKKPLPRFWYFPRGEKAVVVMTGDDHGNGGTAGRFDQLQGRTARRLLGRRLGVHPRHARTSTRARRSPTPQAAGYEAEGFEIGLHVEHRLRGLHAGVARGATTPTSCASSRPTSRACRAPTTNRTHCIAWSDWATQPKVELQQRHPARHQLLLLAAGLGGRPAGLLHRLGHADALRRPRRHDDRRLPGRHPDDRRVRPDLPVHDRHAARPRPRLDRATTAPSPPTCTPTRRRLRRLRRDHRVGEGPRRAGRVARADARPGSTAATARRSARSPGAATGR